MRPSGRWITVARRVDERALPQRPRWITEMIAVVEAASSTGL